MKILEIALPILIIIALLFFWINHERKSAKNEVKIEKLEQENKGQNEIIKISQTQQKLVSKTSVNNDSNARREWLRLIFEERAITD